MLLGLKKQAPRPPNKTLDVFAALCRKKETHSLKDMYILRVGTYMFVGNNQGAASKVILIGFLLTGQFVYHKMFFFSVYCKKKLKGQSNLSTMYLCLTLDRI